MDESRLAGAAVLNAHGLGILEIDFDLVEHRLIVRTSDRRDRGFALAAMSVATFYRRLMDELDATGINVTIDLVPNEVCTP